MQIEPRRDFVCKNCNHEIIQINYAMGPTWMHVDSNAGFPTVEKGSLWRYCKITVAELL